MTIKNKLFVIVDAYGYSRYFRSSLMQSGYICIHLLGTPAALPRLTLLDLEHYDAALIYRGNFSEIVNDIEKLTCELDAELCEILPGAEPGVLLADALSQHFKLHSNGTDKSMARRDKFVMAQTLDRAGIAVPDYCHAVSLDDALRFVSGQRWPVVLKPLNSAGTDGVYFCYSEEDLSNAFHAVVGRQNNMGMVNKSVLLQTFLYGKEYMVNTVSHDGHHYVSDIWIAEKNTLEGHSNIYDKSVLVDSKSQEFLILQEYVFTVLDALEIKFGPAHAEVMITENGPMLVEIGARISGGADPHFHKVCLERDQISLALESYLEPKKFMRKVGTPYNIKKAAMRIHLSSRKTGTIISLDLPEYLEKIPSLINYHLKVNIGDTLVKTFDLSSSPGVVHIASDNEETLRADYYHIQKLFEEHVQVCEIS